MNKGTQCGESNPFAKLTKADVQNIRALLKLRDDARRTARNLTLSSIGGKFGVHWRTIQRIALGDGWFSA